MCLLPGESRGALLEEGAHALAPILGVEEQGEGLRFLAVGGAQRHVVAALDQPLGAGHRQRTLLAIFCATPAVRHQLLPRQHLETSPISLRRLRVD